MLNRAFNGGAAESGGAARKRCRLNGMVRRCPKDTWLRLHKPELVETFTLIEFEKHLREQGRRLRPLPVSFSSAELVSTTGDAAVEETRQLRAGGTNAIFQARFWRAASWPSGLAQARRRVTARPRRRWNFPVPIKCFVAIGAIIQPQCLCRFLP